MSLIVSSNECLSGLKHFTDRGSGLPVVLNTAWIGHLNIVLFVLGDLELVRPLRGLPPPTSVGSSVTRFGDFWKLFVPRFLLKLAQMYGDSIGSLKTSHFKLKLLWLLLISTSGHTGWELVNRQITCVYCKKQGHHQDDCRSCIRDNAPCIANIGKTYFPGRHLIDRISDWPNPRGFTKGVRFVCLNRYIQVNQMPFGQSEIRSIRVLQFPKEGQWGHKRTNHQQHHPFGFSLKDSVVPQTGSLDVMQQIILSICNISIAANNKIYWMHKLFQWGNILHSTSH